MHISVANDGDSDDLLTLEIASDLTVKDLKMIIAAETSLGIEPADMNLFYDGRCARSFRPSAEEHLLLQESCCMMRIRRWSKRS